MSGCLQASVSLPPRCQPMKTAIRPAPHRRTQANKQMHQGRKVVRSLMMHCVTGDTSLFVQSLMVCVTHA